MRYRNVLKGMLKYGTIEQIPLPQGGTTELLFDNVNYSFPAKEDSEMARLYPKDNGLTKLTRSLRNVFCNELQIQDVDMRLAFLAIFAGLCGHHAVYCPSALTEVLENRENRDQFYEKVAGEMSPPETDMKRVKKRVNAVFHLGSPGSSSTLKQFRKDMIFAINSLKATGDDDILGSWRVAERSAKGKKANVWECEDGTKIEDGNVLGKFVARLARHNERRIVTKMLELVCQAGFTVITYEYDGMKLYNKLTNQLTEEKLDEVTKQLKERGDFKSIAQHVTFVLKPMEVDERMQGIVDNAATPKGLVIYDFESIPEIKHQVDNHMDAAEHFIENFGHQLKCCLGELYWRGSQIWKPLSGKTCASLLKNWVSKIDYFTVSESGQETIISRFLKSRNDIAKFVEDLAAELCKDDELLIRCEASTIGKLCFQDGVYFFKTGGFHEWCPELLNEVHSLKMVSRNFPRDIDQERVTALRKELFDGMFISDAMESAAALEDAAAGGGLPVGADGIGARAGNEPIPETAVSRRNDLLEQSNQLVKRLARGMAGHGQTDKIGSACIGARNCGKTLITDLLEGAFGRCDEGGYIATVNGTAFLKKTITDGDPRQYQWLAPTIGARVCVAAETPPASSGGLLDSTIIKKIIGSDRFQIRMNFKDTMYIRASFALVMVMNDSPVRLGHLL